MKHYHASISGEPLDEICQTHTDHKTWAFIPHWRQFRLPPFLACKSHLSQECLTLPFAMFDIFVND